MLLAVISDTHMPKGNRRIPPAAVERLQAAELIIHAGDISTGAVLRELEGYGPPVAAVHGNVDEAELRRQLPERLVLELQGLHVGVIHDAGPARGRLQRLQRQFPACAAVIFGHSHIPLHEQDPAGFQIFNPGSPTERRRQPTHTMGLARIDSGAITFRLVQL